jgi:ADP-ribose pyrophosphatase
MRPIDDVESLQNLRETQITSSGIYDGKVLKMRQDTVELPNGEHGYREVLSHPGGIVILPVLDDGKILLIKQFRYALNKVIYEFPAGKLEPGEDPFECAKRELEEETGYAANQWQSCHYVYTAPGFCNEKLYLYKATELTKLENPHTEDDEFIEVVTHTIEELVALIKQGVITDAKTVCGVFWLQLS